MRRVSLRFVQLIFCVKNSIFKNLIVFLEKYSTNFQE